MFAALKFVRATALCPASQFRSSKQKTASFVTADKVMLKDGGPVGASDSPAVEGRAYFVLLLNAARDGFKRFGQNWDSTEALRSELAKLEKERG